MSDRTVMQLKLGIQLKIKSRGKTAFPVIIQEY